MVWYGMAESTVLKPTETGKVKRQCPYFKAKVLEAHRGDDTDKPSKKKMNKNNLS